MNWNAQALEVIRASNVGVRDDELLEVEHDHSHGRVWAMWDRDGVRYRANVLRKVGSMIPMHSHSYAHSYYVAGVGCEYEARIHKGEQVEVRTVRSGDAGYVPAGERHDFTLTKGEIGAVVCYWRIP